MTTKVDTLQVILQADPLPRMPALNTPEETKRYLTELNLWLGRLLNKLTSKNIHDGIDSIS